MTSAEEVLNVISVMHTKGFVPRILEQAVAANVTELVIENVREGADEMDKLVHTKANHSVSEKMVQVVERTNVDDFEGKIGVSKNFTNFLGRFCLCGFKKETFWCNLAEVVVESLSQC